MHLKFQTKNYNHIVYGLTDIYGNNNIPCSTYWVLDKKHHENLIFNLQHKFTRELTDQILHEKMLLNTFIK